PQEGWGGGHALPCVWALCLGPVSGPLCLGPLCLGPLCLGPCGWLRPRPNGSPLGAEQRFGGATRLPAQPAPRGCLLHREGEAGGRVFMSRLAPWLQTRIAKSSDPSDAYGEDFRRRYQRSLRRKLGEIECASLRSMLRVRELWEPGTPNAAVRLPAHWQE